MFIRFFVSCFFFVAVKFFFVVDEFFQQYYICWVTARSPSHIYKHLLRFLCNKMPCRPIYFFFLHFILFNSKALEFFFFFLSLQCPAMVFAQIGGAVPNAGAFSFIFPQKSRSHWIIQLIYRIQETMNTVIRRMSYKSRDVDRILLLKKYYFTVNWNNFFYKQFHRMSSRKLLCNFHLRYFFSLLNEKKNHLKLN